MSYGIGRFVFGKDNPQEAHLLMFPEMKTTLNGLSFCQISLYSFVWVKSRNCGNSSREGLLSIRPACRLVLFLCPFFPKTSLFTPVFSRVLKFVVLMEFLPNLLRKSIQHCSLFATPKEWLQIFADENPGQLQTTFPLTVIDLRNRSYKTCHHADHVRWGWGIG